MGTTYLARSNPFGYFTFLNVPTGTTYSATATSKQQQFSSQMVTIADDFSNLNFIAIP
jgi:hypothetical protein